MIRYRVTELTRRHDGTDWARIHGPYVNRAEAYRFADLCRLEDPDAVVDVVAIDERGNYIPDDRSTVVHSHRSDEAAVTAMTRAIEAGVEPRPLPPRT